MSVPKKYDETKVVIRRSRKSNIGFDFWCLTPLSAINQIRRDNKMGKIKRTKGQTTNYENKV